jgi:glycosyltransferase involved in cell wall biosynthesis
MDFADKPYDGFVRRHIRFISVARRAADVHLLLLGAVSEGSQLHGTLRDLPRHVIEMPDRPTGRSRQHLPWRPDPGWTRLVTQHLDGIDASAAITLGPWLDEEYAPLFESRPTIHVFEEDVTRMSDIASQRIRARAARRVSRLLRSRVIPTPGHVVVIAPTEVEHAKRRYGSRVRYTCIPQTLEPTWPSFADRSSGDELLCAGVLSEPRNAEPLAEIVRELGVRRRPPEMVVRLVSGTGLHPALQEVARYPWVRTDTAVESLAGLYRRARIAVVPAERATGVKATILQAWSCGCPVAAMSGSADTVGLRNRAALLSAPSPAELVTRLLGAWNDPAALDRLSRNGHVALARDFNDDVAMDAWRDLVTELVDGGAAAGS